MIPRRPPSAISPAGVAAYVVLAPITSIALVHHVVWRDGNAYLFRDLAASRATSALMFVASAIVAALVELRAQPNATRLQLVVMGHATLCAFTQIAAFYLFANEVYFARFTPIAAISLGLLSGAVAAALPRVLYGIKRAQNAVLDLLAIEVLAPTLAVVVVLLGVAHKAGPLRVGIALAALSAALTAVGAAATIRDSKRALRVQIGSAICASAIALLLPFVQPLVPAWEVALAPDPVVLAMPSSAGRVTLTSGRGAFQLFTDGTLRASSIDGYRFRESLVHPLVSSLTQRARVLVIGGGDGQAVREVLRYPEVHEVVVVEPMAPLLKLAREQAFLLSENDHSLDDPRVRTLVADPIVWLRSNEDRFDVVIVDLGEPAGPTRGKLFTTYFFRLLHQHMNERAAGVMATVSPMANRRAFWSIVSSFEEANFSVLPYRADIPTFGVVGFVMFSSSTLPSAHVLPRALSYLDDEMLAQMLRLAPDEDRIEAEPNRLYHQVFLKYRAE
ncbi:MAG: hypothetical protein U0165_00465 [Polyangiaceae bacterium]